MDGAPGLANDTGLEADENHRSGHGVPRPPPRVLPCRARVALLRDQSSRKYSTISATRETAQVPSNSSNTANCSDTALPPSGDGGPIRPSSARPPYFPTARVGIADL
jgi:hypothetical protein